MRREPGQRLLALAAVLPAIPSSFGAPAQLLFIGTSRRRRLFADFVQVSFGLPRLHRQRSAAVDGAELPAVKSA